MMYTTYDKYLTLMKNLGPLSSRFGLVASCSKSNILKVTFFLLTLLLKILELIEPSAKFDEFMFLSCFSSKR